MSPVADNSSSSVSRLLTEDSPAYTIAGWIQTASFQDDHEQGILMQSVLAIAAHPDDIEFFMSGTFMLLGRAGWELHYMNLANGCCGTTQFDRETIAEIRRKEARQAADSIGAVFHESICNDLEIFYDKPTLNCAVATQ